MSRPLPLFILGLQRSGTTWLANLLAAHPDVVAIQSDDHFGVHESIFFSHFARAYGDIADDENFECFVREFTISDYYLLSGLGPEWLRGCRPRSYAQAFRELMEEVARRRGGARYWLEKSPHHTLLAEELAGAFPDGRFVAITRDPASHLRSRLWAQGPPPPQPIRALKVLRLAAAGRFYQRWLERFAAAGEGRALVRYEDLAGAPEHELRRLCGLLDLRYEPVMLERRFRPNTSFPQGRDRRQELTRLDRAVLAATGAAVSLVPLRLLTAIARRRARARGVEWPDWTWRRRDAGGLTA